jgi:multiple sugar transport system permease protein
MRLTVPSVAGQARYRSRSGLGRRRRAKHALTGYLFIAPFLVTFVGVLLIPLGYALYISLFNTRLVGGTVFVGLANYRAAFTDPLFLHGMRRVTEYLLFQAPVMLGLALFFALALDSGRVRFVRFIRLGMFVPYAVPSVVAALMWGYLYGSSFGPFAEIARALGATPFGFLSSKWMLGSIANIVWWEFTGYTMVVIYAALRTIPAELYEAASVDGAGPVRTAWSIKIPMIRPVLQLLAFFAVIGAFQLFNEPNIMAAVAPTVIGSSYTPNLYAYNLVFANQQANYAAAVSFLVGFAILVSSYVLIFVINRKGRGL